MDDLEQQRICAHCIGESYLRGRIREEGVEAECGYCGNTDDTVEFIWVADRVEAAFDQHFEITPSEPNSLESMMQRDRESDYEWYRKGEEAGIAIMNALDSSEEIGEDVRKILDNRHSDWDSAMAGYETPFSDECHYEEIMPSGQEWESGWRDLVRSITSEVRYFSGEAANRLGALFDGIEGQRTVTGRPTIISIGPKRRIRELHRARAFQSSERLEAALARPDLEMSAPPARLASSGRMNAKGISTFYGATTRATALAEVRPPVGSEVAIATFTITRPLRILDLDALQDVRIAGSIFDPEYATQLGRMKFLHTLSSRISRPVMPDDQDVEYMPTQAVADYLASRDDLNLDGILFPSVQVGGKGRNVVLFRKASRCENLELPKGTEISARSVQQYAEGWEREYTVIEERPPPTRADPLPARDLDFDFHDYRPLEMSEPSPAHDRIPTLRVRLDNLEVRIVEVVKYKTSDHKVTRHSWEKSEKGPF